MSGRDDYEVIWNDGDSSGSSSAGAGDLAEYLKSNFLDDSNRIKWGALGSSVFGGIIYAFWDGVIATAEAVGKSAEELTSPTETAIESGANALGQTIATSVSETFTALDVGALSGVANLVIAIASMLVIAYVIQYVWSLRGDF